TGNGTRPKKALRASQIITFESLPSDHSSAIFLSRAKASRKMKMLGASRSSRRSIGVTPRRVRARAKRRRHEPSLFCGEGAFDLPRCDLSKVEYFSICSAETLC